MNTVQTHKLSITKGVLFFVFLIVGSYNSYGQAPYLNTRVSGYAKFKDVKDLEWENDRGKVILYKEKVVYCNKNESCMEVAVYGKVKSEETKFKGKKYTVYYQHGTNENGEAVVVRKYIAKNHDKYFDLLWIHNEQKEDIVLECSTLMKKRKK